MAWAVGSRTRLQLVLSQTTVVTSITSHIPDLGFWQLQKFPCIFAPCLVPGDGQKREALSAHRGCC